MPYVNIAIIKAQKGFNAAALLKQGFHLQPFLDGKCPEGMCPPAWSSMRALAKGEGNFYDGWMKNPMSAMISCNDGFRPFSFYIEVI